MKKLLTITATGLSGTGEQRTWEAQQTEEVIGTIGPEITELAIKCDNFSQLLRVFIGCIEKIPSEVTSLNLSGNNFCQFTPILNAIFTPLSRHKQLETLDLHSCQLYGLHSGSFEAIFKTIQQITTLNLSDNELNRVSAEEIKKLKGTLPKLETIYLSETEVKLMTPEQLKAFVEIFPNIQRIVLLKQVGDELTEEQRKIKNKVGAVLLEQVDNELTEGQRKIKNRVDAALGLMRENRARPTEALVEPSPVDSTPLADSKQSAFSSIRSFFSRNGGELLRALSVSLFILGVFLLATGVLSPFAVIPFGVMGLIAGVGSIVASIRTKEPIFDVMPSRGRFQENGGEGDLERLDTYSQFGSFGLLQPVVQSRHGSSTVSVESVSIGAPDVGIRNASPIAEDVAAADDADDVAVAAADDVAADEMVDGVATEQKKMMSPF